jgi:hypothetical protein
MAISLIGSNLNIYGNAGNFETDPSGWGFGLVGSRVTMSRSSVQKTKNAFSCRGIVTSAASTSGFPIPLAKARATFVNGLKYIAKAKVFVPSSALISNALQSIFIDFESLVPNATSIVSDPTTVGDATDVFVEITMTFIATANGTQNINVNLGTVAYAQILNGIAYVDEFEIYQYEEILTPEELEFDDTTFSNNQTWFTIAQSGSSTEDNYERYIEVRVEEDYLSGTFVKTGAWSITPNTEGDCIFNLRPGFRNIFNPQPPAYNLNTPTLLTDRIKRYKVAYGDIYDDLTEPASFTLTDPLLVLLGGINKKQFPNLDFFNTYLPANKKFLTWAPLSKIVDRGQEDYLNFYVYDSFLYNRILVRIKAYFSDGTNQTETIITLNGVLQGELYRIPSGPINSGAVGIDEEKTLIKYELTLVDDGLAPISETRTYTISSFTSTQNRYFMFINSLGADEVLRFTGFSSESAKIQNQYSTRVLAKDYAALDGELVKRSASIRDEGSYSSGYFDGPDAKDWGRYMKDFLISNQVYLLQGTQRIPVVIDQTDYEITRETDYRYFVRFKILGSYEDEVYTPDTI